MIQSQRGNVPARFTCTDSLVGIRSGVMRVSICFNRSARKRREETHAKKCLMILTIGCLVIFEMVV